MTMKPKRWNKRRKYGLNVTRLTSIETMGRISRYWVDKRLNYLNPTLSQSWSIMLTMLSPMGGWTLKMMWICYIGWSKIAVNMYLFLIKKYRISWFCTCNVRLVHVIQVEILWIWKTMDRKILQAIEFIFRPDLLYSRCNLPK